MEREWTRFLEWQELVLGREDAKTGRKGKGKKIRREKKGTELAWKREKISKSEGEKKKKIPAED